MASSTGHSVGSNLKQRRKKQPQTENTTVNSPKSKLKTSPPRFAVSNYHGKTIDQPLIPLATVLLDFDYEFAKPLSSYHKQITRGNNKSLKQLSARIRSDCSQFKGQRKAIISSAVKCQLNQAYLRNSEFVSLWRDGVEALKIRSNGLALQKRLELMRQMTIYEAMAQRLKHELILAAQRGLLDAAILSSIRERWLIFEDFVDWYYNHPVWTSSRDKLSLVFTSFTPTWQEVHNSLQPRKPNNTTSQAKPIQMGYTRIDMGVFEPESQIIRQTKATFHLWWTLFASVVVSGVFFSLGYGHSPHIAGSKNDDDFWFLIQATITQLPGLVLPPIFQRRRRDPLKWRWNVLNGFAATCSVAAVPFYLAVPKEWSSFLSALAGATQTFMMLQQYLL